MMASTALSTAEFATPAFGGMQIDGNGQTAHQTASDRSWIDIRSGARDRSHLSGTVAVVLAITEERGTIDRR
jgi:hypothetical protein